VAKSSGGDRHPQASMAGMVLIRVFLGAFFLYTGLSKLTTFHQTMGDAFINLLRNATSGDIPSHGMNLVTHSIWPFYADFLVNVVNPHVEMFAWMVIIGEILVGALFIIGLLTRGAALVAFIMNCCYLLGTYHLGLPQQGLNIAFIIMELAVFIAAAGRTLGIDYFLAAHTRVKLFW